MAPDDPTRTCGDAGSIELDLNLIDRAETSRSLGSISVSVNALDGGLSWSSTVMPMGQYVNGEACGPGCVAHAERVVLEPR